MNAPLNIPLTCIQILVLCAHYSTRNVYAVIPINAKHASPHISSTQQALACLAHR